MKSRPLTDLMTIDWEIGMRESGGPELAALGDLL
jgi:hypothetical protein